MKFPSKIMKPISIIATCAFLSACSVFTSQFFHARDYDPVEYSHAVAIVTNATHAIHRCNEQQGPEYQSYVQAINHDTLYLVEYVTNKNDNQQVLPATMQVRDITKDFLNHVNPSYDYCRHKASNLQASARMLARALGSGGDGYDACQGDAQSRYTLFEESYKQGKISKEEFSNLVADLMKLQTIDTSGCVLETRERLQSALHLIKTSASVLGAI